MEAISWLKYHTIQQKWTGNINGDNSNLSNGSKNLWKCN